MSLTPMLRQLLTEFRNTASSTLSDEWPETGMEIVSSLQAKAESHFERGKDFQQKLGAAPNPVNH